MKKVLKYSQLMGIETFNFSLQLMLLSIKYPNWKYLFKFGFFIVDALNSFQMLVHLGLMKISNVIKK